MKNIRLKLITYLAFIGYALLLQPAAVNAQELNLDVTNEITVNQDLSGDVITTLLINNLDPAKITGSYIYSVPFKYSAVNYAKFNGEIIGYTELNNEFNQIEFDFKAEVINYNQSGKLEISYSVESMVQQTYDGFFEFYMPKINFDEEISTYRTSIYTPSTFPSLSYSAGSAPVTMLSGVQSSNNENLYFIWSDGYEVALKQSYQFQKFSKINLASSVVNSYYLQESLNASRGYLDAQGNAWAEFDYEGSRNVIYNFRKSNSAPDLINGFDFSSYAEFPKDLNTLEKVYTSYLDFLSSKTVVQSSTDVTKESISNIYGLEKVSELNICAYFVGAAQAQGYYGRIYYGYNVSQLLPSNNPTKPAVWCMISDGTKHYIMDPLLSKQLDIVLDTKSDINKIAFGTYALGNNLLGVADSNPIFAELVPTFSNTNGDILLSISLQDKVKAFSPFDAQAYIKNNSAEVYAIDKFSIGAFKYSFNEQLPLVLPFQENFVDIQNVRLGYPWQSGNIRLNASIEYQKQVLAQNKVSVVIYRDNETLAGISLTAVLALLLIVFVITRINLSKDSKNQSKKTL